jgi:hypothetical protein
LRLTQISFNSCLLFYSNYPLHVSAVRPSSRGNIYIGIYSSYQPHLSVVRPSSSHRNIQNNCYLEGRRQFTVAYFKLLLLLFPNLEKRDYGRRGSAAQTTRHPSIRESWN